MSSSLQPELVFPLIQQHFVIVTFTCYLLVLLFFIYCWLRSNQSILKEISRSIHQKDLCWSWNSNTLATWSEEVTHWKSPWCWERLKAGEGDDRGWDGLDPSPTQWTWVWASFGSWWWTGKPGVLQSIGLQRVGHHWVIELNWFIIICYFYYNILSFL